MESVYIKILPAALALFAIFSGMSLAQGITLEKAPFQERVSEYSKVSGDIVMGVMLTGDEASGREPSIVTGVAPDWTESGATSPVCVRLVTKDGRYEAENTYLIEPGYSGDTGAVPVRGTIRPTFWPSGRPLPWSRPAAAAIAPTRSSPSSGMRSRARSQVPSASTSTPRAIPSRLHGGAAQMPSPIARTSLNSPV